MEPVLRVAFVYVFLLTAFRLLGKREIGQLSPFELVVIISIPEIFADALTGGDHSMTAAVIGGSTLLVLVLGTSMLSHRFKWFETITEGGPTVLVHDGRFLEDNLNRERVQTAEVFTQMRMTGLERLEQVRWAILEGDGKISIVPSADERMTSRLDDEHIA